MTRLASLIRGTAGSELLGLSPSGWAKGPASGRRACPWRCLVLAASGLALLALVFASASCRRGASPADRRKGQRQPTPRPLAREHRALGRPSARQASRRRPGTSHARDPILHPSAQFVRVRSDAGRTWVEYKLPTEGFGKYYDRVMPEHGWHKLRGILSNERTLCGGTWGGLYEKDGEHLFFEICGMTNYGYDSKRKKWFTHYCYDMTFRLEDGLQPVEVFGVNYRQNPVPRPRPSADPTYQPGLFGD